MNINVLGGPLRANNMRSVIFLCGFIFLSPVIAQSGGASCSSVQLQGGTSIFYSRFHLKAETSSLVSIKDKHHFKLTAGAGLFSMSFTSTTRGYLVLVQPTYILGANKHHLEVAAGISWHFHNKLEGGGISYLGLLPSGFLGYRYQNPEKPTFFKIGVGGLDMLQVGIGVRLNACNN